MIFINSVILFITKLYSTKLYSIKLYTKNYLKNDDYISHIINIHKNKNSNNNLINNYYYNVKEHIFNKNNTIDGFDMRKNITDNISIYNISVFFYKKTLLDILNNYGVNINNKINNIEEYNKIFNENKCYNIYGGGLMKDWNF